MKSLFQTLLVLSLFFPHLVIAEIFTCTIKNVSKLNNNGQFVSHGWKANYLNREFTIDRETGKVLSTTALKERLNNSDAIHQPVFIKKSKETSEFKVFTNFEKNGTYALFDMHDADRESNNKPYFYHTSIGMILSGTCSIKR